MGFNFRFRESLLFCFCCLRLSFLGCLIHAVSKVTALEVNYIELLIDANISLDAMDWGEALTFQA